MTARHALHLIHTDYRRYRATGRGQGSLLGIVLFTQGFWASSVYRIGHWCFEEVSFPVVGALLRIFFTFAKTGIEILTGISIPYTCKIGEGLYIGHFGGIIIHSHALIGSNCNLSQGITIGMVQYGERKGVPQIGDRVYIGPNAVVIGKIIVGDDVAIGAGAIVIDSVPDCSVAVGNPAKVVSQKGSFELVRFDNMDACQARQRNLELSGKK